MYLEKFELWKKNVTNEAVASELRELEGNEQEIKNRFFKDLEFGTGGLRGVLGAGSNLMNVYTVGKATQGIANYMKENSLKSVAVSHDSRNMSREFAIAVCEIFAGNGIKSYLSEELMPTPFLSYCVRALKADMGVMITASHNPAKYNGYKVYDSTGCQLANESAQEILDCMNSVDIFSGVLKEDFKKASASGTISLVPSSVERDYLDDVKKSSVGEIDPTLKIVYTPLNGAGYRLCPQILRERGIEDVVCVSEQSVPSGDFATCPYPNPEMKEALELGIKELKRTNASVLIATDPDADRMGLAFLHNGEEVLLSGNQTGALLMDFILSQRQKQGTLPTNPVCVKTIVTSNICQRIAAKYGAELRNVLTGFKYIGGIINELAQNGQSGRYVFGFEESYGYMAGDHVRDKDAVQATMLAAELVSHLKAQGKTLKDRLDELYDEFGFFVHTLLNFEFAGADGFAHMQDLMQQLRSNPPKAFGEFKVCGLTDYMGFVAQGLPRDNVLVFALDGGGEVVVRPSGTEPKLKAYLTMSGKKEQAVQQCAQLANAVSAIIKK